MPEVVGQSSIERRFDGKLRQHPGKLVKVSFGFKTISQFSSQRFEFLLVHNLPVSVVGGNISLTGNYTILITVSAISGNNATIRLSIFSQKFQRV
ncbi:hypothetical protein ACW59N_002366 [Salmonella enterica]|nr:hypothetical protein SEHO0A_01018 [Salmonella enterica subsp. houtenae str. ATCC BAA-1581]